MAIRPPRAAAAARNLVMTLMPRFVGDPAGMAITQGALAGVTPSMAGNAGVRWHPGEGGMESGFHGYAKTPQPALQARTYVLSHGAAGNTFRNGPNDYGASISAEAGNPFLDARYRALASRMMRST